jgi:hypothetical protein
MEERRREPRIRSLLSGRILHDGRRCTLDCTIRNLSPHGAMVALPEAFRMPESFDLAIPHRDDAHHAVLVWRRGESAGLALSPVQAAVADVRKTKMWLQGSRRPERRGMTLGY